MIDIAGAICSQSLTKMHKRKAPIRIYFDLKGQGFRNLDSSSLNNPRTPRPLTGFKKTIGTITVIKKAVVIVAFVDPNFQALLQLLKLI